MTETTIERSKKVMITMGIDGGSINTKSVILEERNILGFNVLPSGEDVSGISVKASVEQSLTDVGLSLSQISQIAATGVGRNNIPYPAKLVSEIRCDSMGTRFLYPSARGIIDIGAESCRVMKCDEKGKAVDFAVNDKCAGGTGAFLEAMAKVLQITPQELGETHQTEQLVSITSSCAVFAESEVISQIHKGNKNRLDIWRGINNSLAQRLSTLIGRLHIDGEIVVIGGAAMNADLIDCLKEIIDIKLLVPPRPQIVGALGAAIIAREGR